MNRILGAGALPAMAAAVLGLNAVEAYGEANRQAPIVQQTVELPKTLPQLVNDYKTGFELDEEGKCLATAVYFEARSESLEGQLAVADVVLNRANAEQYPENWCEVVKQSKQFSFVQNRRFPKVTDMESWEKAEAVARIAIEDAYEIVPEGVLWYHADYVAPVWRHNLSQVAKVGVHIFYEA